MNHQNAARVSFERKLFLIPFCGGIIIAIYFFVRLGHGPLSPESTIIRILKIATGIVIAVVSWFLGFRQKTTILNFERKPFLVPFSLGALAAVYALLRLGHGPSPLGTARIAKIIAGTAIAAVSWLASSSARVHRVQSWLLSLWLKIQKLLGWLQGGIRTVVLKIRNVLNWVQKGIFTVRQRAAFALRYLASKAPQGHLKRMFLFWLAFSAGLFWLGPFTEYTPPGFLDPWIYTGYFTNFHDLVNRFGLLYYPSRLPYVLFGVLVYKVFSPLAANYLINVCLLTIDTISLYAILLRHTGRWIATATTLVFALNPYLMGTICWDYPDGPAIAFLLLGFWMLLAPPQSLKTTSAAVLVGVFWAMAGYTILITGLVIIPGLMIVLHAQRASLRKIIQQFVCIAAGVGLATLIFGLISLHVFHRFDFWTAQLEAYRAVTKDPGFLENMWKIIDDWLVQALRLGLTYGIGLIGCIIFIWYFRTLRNDQFFQAALLLLVLSDLVFAYVQVGMHAVVLRVWYHSTYLVVPVFIFAGALFSAIYKIQGNDQKRWLAMIPILALIPVYARTFLLHNLWRPQTRWVILLTLGVVGLIAACLGDNLRRYSVKVALGCMTMLISLSPCLDVSASDVAFSGSRLEFKAAIATQAILQSGILKGRKFLFWYDSDEPQSLLYYSIHSMSLFGYRDLTHELQTMSVEDLRYYIPPDTVIIHLTAVPAKVPKRVRLLATRNVRVEDIGHWTVQRGDIEFEVFAQHVLNASELK